MFEICGHSVPNFLPTLSIRILLQLPVSAQLKASGSSLHLILQQLLTSSTKNMGVKSFINELETKISPGRLFKALITESPEIVPKFNKPIKSIEIVEGHGFGVGCIFLTHFNEGLPFKYVKHRIDEIDTQNYVCKYTLIEGDVLGDKLEKICHELRLEASADGGCVLKSKAELHAKAGVELDDEEIKAGKEQALNVYKACEEYLAANPHVCA
ncbi:UNVERIFIED_CONTAM: Pathogenesis-related protein STH-2 [Sesamum angustifolium]|uniref:Pathogenesis-related protein STH-2 n=1 Tax=Sesamum angustifolium TaxID=2727405 RepID=A0AAW2LTB2_9LAMI